MIRIGLRDARSHFGRFIMSIVAIALGVSFVVGSFCFREMLNNQVSQMMSTNADHDVYVRGSQEKKKDSSAMSMGSTKSYNDVDVDLAGTIAKVDGVSSARVVHMLSGVVLLDKHGDAVTTMGSPTLAIGMGKSSPWRSAKFTTGTWPKNGDEIALHSFAAEQSGLKRGRRHLRHQLRVRLRLPARQHGHARQLAGAARAPLRHRRRGGLHPDR